ncbi:MAG: hypothetical protein IJ268_11180 [Proteobacteria bacterium]|nr:hypothetical protein [Pseudomonadota bacterium]
MAGVWNEKCRSRIDKVGIELSHDSLETDENGKSVNVRARLASIPYASVTVPLMLSDPDEAVLSVERLVIEPEAWQSEQIVTIKGLPDNRKDGNKKYLLEFGAAEFEDEHYSGFQLDALELTNMDVNRAGIEVTAEHSLATTEAGGSVSVEVSLASEPSSDVTMLVSVSDDTEAEVSPTEIVFTPDNWYERQKITVTGRDDSESDGDQSFMLEFSPLASLDLNYGGIVPDPISVRQMMSWMAQRTLGCRLQAIQKTAIS